MSMSRDIVGPSVGAALFVFLIAWPFAGVSDAASFSIVSAIVFAICTSCKRLIKHPDTEIVDLVSKYARSPSGPIEMSADDYDTAKRLDMIDYEDGRAYFIGRQVV